MNRILMVFTILLLLTVALSAQQPLSLTVEQAVHIGLENSKALRTSQYKVQAAKAKADETATFGLPSLKVQGAYSRLSDIPPATITTPFGTFPIAPTVLDNYSLKATVQQPLFTGWKISGAEQAAEYSAEATQYDFNKDKADVIYNIKAAYWNLYRANEFKKFVDENVQQIQSHVTDAENLLRQGMLTSNDVLKVRVQLSDAKVRQIDAANNVRLAMIALNNTLGLPLSTNIVIASSLQPTTSQQQTELQLLVQRAFESRPDILAMNARVKASDAVLTSTRGGWWPQIYLVGNYNYLRPNPRIFPTKDEFKDTWDVSVSVSFDLWNWNQTGHQTTQAEAQLAQAEEGLSLLKDGVTLEVTQNYLAVNQSKERAAVAEQGVEQAEENYRIMSEKFKKGLVPNSELLDAEVALLQAKLNRTQSLVEYELAVARLAKSIGE